MTRERWRALGVHVRHVGILAAVTGAVTGLGVAAFDRVVQSRIFERVLDLPLWAQAVAPAVGLSAAALILRIAGPDAMPSTADEYVKDFHAPDHRLGARDAPAKVLASAATLGGGAAMGFEGPSIYSAR